MFEFWKYFVIVFCQKQIYSKNTESQLYPEDQNPESWSEDKKLQYSMFIKELEKNDQIAKQRAQEYNPIFEQRCPDVMDDIAKMDDWLTQQTSNKDKIFSIWGN